MVASVVYQWAAKANVELDTTAHPVAVLYLFRDGSIDLTEGVYREIAEVNVLFLTHQSQLSFDGTANDALLSDMIDVATEFVARLLDDGTCEVIGNEIVVRGIYDFDDKNTTGVSLQFRVRELQGHCLTPTEPEPEPEPNEDNQQDTK